MELGAAFRDREIAMREDGDRADARDTILNSGYRVTYYVPGIKVG